MHGSPFQAPLETLAQLSWLDWTCVGILVLASVVGLCKGFVWQVGRIAALAGAVLLTVQWGPDVGGWLATRFGHGPGDPGGYLFLGRGILFVGGLAGGLVLASAAARAVSRGPLKAVDRLGGGVVGLALGSGVLIAAFAGALLFVPGASSNEDAQSSHAMRYSRQVVGMLGDWAPDGLRRVYGFSVDSKALAPRSRALDLPRGPEPANSDPAPAAATGSTR